MGLGRSADVRQRQCTAHPRSSKSAPEWLSVTGGIMPARAHAPLLFCPSAEPVSIHTAAAPGGQ